MWIVAPKLSINESWLIIFMELMCDIRCFEFQSALQRMINRNQGKVGFSVSTCNNQLQVYLVA